MVFAIILKLGTAFKKKCKNILAFSKSNYLCNAFEKSTSHILKMARSSRGQDTGFSFLKHGFDSRTGYLTQPSQSKDRGGFLVSAKVFLIER